jgi:hypothetical protein
VEQIQTPEAIETATNTNPRSHRNSNSNDDAGQEQRSFFVVCNLITLQYYY